MERHEYIVYWKCRKCGKTVKQSCEVRYGGCDCSGMICIPPPEEKGHE